MQEDRFFSLQEICVLLNIAPKTFRQLLREFADLLEWAPPEGAEPQGLPAKVFERLRTIVRLRAEGEDVETIRKALCRPVEECRQSEGLPRIADSDASSAAVVAMLRDLSEDLKRAEDQWREEREKILTALIRVQQELQGLRYELVSQTSRRERKRKSFWASLLGV